jgi:hypothetical protein
MAKDGVFEPSARNAIDVVVTLVNIAQSSLKC